MHAQVLPMPNNWAGAGLVFPQTEEWKWNDASLCVAEMRVVGL